MLFKKVIYGNIVNKVIYGNIVNMMLTITEHPIYNNSSTWLLMLAFFLGISMFIISIKPSIAISYFFCISKAFILQNIFNHDSCRLRRWQNIAAFLEKMLNHYLFWSFETFEFMHYTWNTVPLKAFRWRKACLIFYSSQTQLVNLQLHLVCFSKGWLLSISECFSFTS